MWTLESTDKLVFDGIFAFEVSDHPTSAPFISDLLLRLKPQEIYHKLCIIVPSWQA